MGHANEASPKPIIEESRHEPRPRTLLGGKIVFRDGSCSFNCTVRDMNEAGARVQIGPEQLVPKRFYLLTPKHASAFDVEIVWQRGATLGLRILKKIKLSESNLPFLKRLSAELRPRP